MKKNTKRKIVYVEWVDSVQPQPSWRQFDDLSDFDLAPCICVSIGWVIRETDDALSLAISLSDEGTDSMAVSGLATIPKTAITKIVTVNVKARNRKDVP